MLSQFASRGRLLDSFTFAQNALFRAIRSACVRSIPVSGSMVVCSFILSGYRAASVLARKKFEILFGKSSILPLTMINCPPMMIA